jgi:putative ABC transport system permease protein
MNFYQLIFRSLAFYRRSHLAVAAGVAICTMVITGALIVGDSIRASLEQAAVLRLGKTDFVFSGIDRFFRSSLAGDLPKELAADAAPLLQLTGFATSQGGELRANNVQVMGIDSRFLSFVPGDALRDVPAEHEAFISDNLAQRLQLSTGDALLLRVAKAGQIPKNAPFVSDAQNQIALRLVVSRILSRDELGGFNLKMSQSAPYNVFVSLAFLNDRMELEDKANKLLIGGNSAADRRSISQAIGRRWMPEDLALKIHPVNDGAAIEIRSERIFMDSLTVAAVRQVVPEAEIILTYMVNALRHGDRETPYSFVAAGPFSGSGDETGNGMIINTWMAEDLGASTGDSIEISYYLIGPLRQLREESRWFTVHGVVDIGGVYADRLLMPDLPGLSDAGSCRDWEAGVPVDLDKIREKDEEYWNQYRGTPKAFIPYEAGKALWENRFGVATAIRIPAAGTDLKTLEKRLASLLPPESQGFAVRPAKEEGLAAARGGVDFAQLFLALSFFLLLTGILLMVLLFDLHLQKRTVETGTLQALGYTLRQIKMILLSEGLLVALPGAVAGGILAVVYNKTIFYALNTVWGDIVRTSILQEVVLLQTVATGLLVSLALASAAIWFGVNSSLKHSPAILQRDGRGGITGAGSAWLRAGGWLSGIAATVLLIFEFFFGQSLNTTIFFIAGGLALLAGLLLFYHRIHVEKHRHVGVFSLRSLALKNLARSPARSFRIAVLFALGTFVTIATGLNRKDLHRGSGNPASGTGGFEYYMETAIPVLKDLNDSEVREELGIETPVQFVQMRVGDGDDASCLNLNRVASPRILGIPSDRFSGRFTFVRHTDDLDPEAPWASLKKELPGGVVPAVLDQSVIQWGLGKKTGDTLVYLNEAGSELKLKIVGGLANSVFQGNVLIDDSLFLSLTRNCH